jgi:hypothetical protein
MNFGSSGNYDKKVWRDIWGAGQGVGAIKDIPATADLISTMRGEYRAAHMALNRMLDREKYLEVTKARSFVPSPQVDEV